MKRIAVRSLAAMVLLALVVPGPVLGHDQSHHDKGQSLLGAGAPQVDATAKVKLVDLELVDKDGKPVRFESEAVAGRIVAIDFVYTSCTTICPILSALMAQVQERLGARLGEEMRLISISIDPTRDTPRRLADYARKFNDGPGWLWLTGRKPAVDRVLSELGAYSTDFIDHPPMLVIGDAKRGVWTRVIGLFSPDDVVARLEDLAASRQSHEATLKTAE